jgi:hypothetical protein
MSVSASSHARSTLRGAMFACALMLAVDVTIAGAQSWDLTLWGSAASSMFGPTRHTQLVSAGISAGRVLRDKDGTIRLVYSVQAIPAVLILQGTTVYGGAFTPVHLRFPMRSTGPVIPYFDFGISLLFSKTDVPRNTSTFNFMPQAGLGFLFRVIDRKALSVEVNYLHVSNGYKVPLNPGVNTLQFLIGYHWLL